MKRVAGAIALAAVLALQSGPRAQGLTVSFGDALTLYELGEYETVERGLRVSIAGDHDRVIPLLTREAEAWIALNGKAEIPRRRLVAAAFALELGRAGVDTQWEITRDAVEWACQLLRRAGPPTESERQWHLAALALLEANFEPPTYVPMPALTEHVKHIADRFPKEPRLALARALGRENEFWVQHFRPSSSGVVINDD